MPCLARLESLLTGSNANSIGRLFYTFSALWGISESESPRPRDRLLDPCSLPSACRPPSQRRALFHATDESTGRRLGRHSHARGDPSRGDRLPGRPKPNLARSPRSRLHRSMASSPSAAFLRLRAFFAERMRMSPIDQPLMLMELLGRSSPAPADTVARRIL